MTASGNQTIAEFVAYRELFKALEEQEGWFLEELVAKYNAYVLAKIPPVRSATRALRSFEGYKTDPAKNEKSARTPRGHVRQQVHEFLTLTIKDKTTYGPYLDTIAPVKPSGMDSSKFVETSPEYGLREESLALNKSSNYIGTNTSEHPLYSEEDTERLATVLAISPREVSLKIARANANLGEEELWELKERERKLILPEVLTSFLMHYYAESSRSDLGPYSIQVQKNHIRTPIFVKPSDLRLTMPLDQIQFDQATETSPPSLQIQDSLKDRILKYAVRLRRMGILIENRPLFRLVEEDLKNRRILFYESEFFNYRFSSGLLQDELNDVIFAFGGDLNNFEKSRSHFPLRDQMLPNLNRLQNLQDRICAGGVGVVFALKKGDHYEIQLQVRGKGVSDGRRFLAVVPKAFHGGFNEAALKSTVFRELYKELFEGKRRYTPDRHGAHDYYYDLCEGVEWFEQFEGNKDKYWLDVVAFGLNAVSGNYDFGILLVVEDPNYRKDFRSKMFPNWEADRLCPISTTNEKQIQDVLANKRWAPESLYHFVQGLLHLKKLRPKAVKLPPIKRFIGNDCI